MMLQVNNSLIQSLGKTVQSMVEPCEIYSLLSYYHIKQNSLLHGFYMQAFLDF
jgi:hypothetical protein